MPEIKVAFDNAEAYEHYMGRWSRAIGEKFLAWAAPPPNARWLDVGCGTGAFSELIVQRCAPKSLSGIDPSAAQLDYARAKLAQADLRVADAMAMPFDADEFDVVASALVLHFIPDRAKALREMKRVVRSGGLVAGYTWERTRQAEFAPYSAMLRAIESIGGDVMRSPIVPEAHLEGLQAAIESTGFGGIAVTRIEASQSYRDFEEYWQIQTLPISPPGKSVAKLDGAQRARLRHELRATLPIASDGSITYAARAVAFKAGKA
ncbi:MAG TPA: class I SAM-dependent methyltransferase [Pseudolabrys sp.]|nr:class I SAM-dependent methyltransferase [Pseudolabrys sp.]